MKGKSVLAVTAIGVGAVAIAARLLARQAPSANGSVGDWGMDGQGSYAQHYSSLDKISSANVSRLGLAWYLDIDSPMGLASEPIVIDGVAYVSAPLSRVYAIDAARGVLRWSFDPHIQLGASTQNSYAARANRGVAVDQGRVFVATGDCRLFAIDAATGAKAWEAPICDPAQTGSTGAPRIARGKVFIGYNGSDDKVRGSVVAFDEATGREAWRFWTVPGDPAKGFETPELQQAAKTWYGDHWWTVGGGNVWDAITYDSTTGLLLLGTAEAGGGEGTSPVPIPGGDKLYSNSIVAVNAESGRYVWHYQTGPQATVKRMGDPPENSHIVLADLVIDGTPRHVAMTVPKDGIFFVLDARTGAPISARPIVEVPWADSVDRRTGLFIGRQASSRPDSEPYVPTQWTVHNWWHMSFSPRTGLTYVPAADMRPGATPPKSFEDYVRAMEGRLVAWDPVHQTVRWSVEQPLAVNSSVLSTGGNLVFQGQGTGELDAYTADSGRLVWSIQTGSAIDASPVSYRVNGEQYVLIPVGWGSASRLFGPASFMATPRSKRGPSRLLAFKLGGAVPFPVPADSVPPVPRPPRQTFSAAMVAQGRDLYETHLCGGCHAPFLDGSGAWTVGGAIPDLRYAPPDVHRDWHAIVLGGRNRGNGMLGFGTELHYPDVKALSAKEADAIHAYVIDESWKAYNEAHRQFSDRALGH